MTCVRVHRPVPAVPGAWEMFAERVGSEKPDCCSGCLTGRDRSSLWGFRDPGSFRLVALSRPAFGGFPASSWRPDCQVSCFLFTPVGLKAVTRPHLTAQQQRPAVQLSTWEDREARCG